jgi:hypothetical protein
MVIDRAPLTVYRTNKISSSSVSLLTHVLLLPIIELVITVTFMFVWCLQLLLTSFTVLLPISLLNLFLLVNYRLDSTFTSLKIP